MEIACVTPSTANGIKLDGTYKNNPKAIKKIDKKDINSATNKFWATGTK